MAPDRPLRLLAHVHGYPPVHMAGAEMMLHTLLRDLAAAGVEVRVAACLPGLAVSTVLDGVAVEARPSRDRLVELWDWCDVGLTHLDLTVQATAYAAAADKPLAHLVHADFALAARNVTKVDLAIVNSAWVGAAVGDVGPKVLLYPHVRSAEYRVEAPGECVTLVNCNAAKGAATFYALAAACPDRRFLAVEGSYGEQVLRAGGNVTVQAKTTNMRDDVYARSRVVLMPSAYESWGRVAIEACSSGIPVVAHPTPGLREALGAAGIFCDRDDTAAWVAALERLDDPGEYARASAACRARAAALDAAAVSQVADVHAALVDLVARFRDLPALDATRSRLVRRGVWVTDGRDVALMSEGLFRRQFAAHGWRLAD